MSRRSTKLFIVQAVLAEELDAARQDIAAKDIQIRHEAARNMRINLPPCLAHVIWHLPPTGLVGAT